MMYSRFAAKSGAPWLFLRPFRGQTAIGSELLSSQHQIPRESPKKLLELLNQSVPTKCLLLSILVRQMLLRLPHDPQEVALY